MLNSLASVLTVVCLTCTLVQCLGLVDHLDLGHIAKSIWIIKLEKKRRTNQYGHRFQLNQKQLFQLLSSFSLDTYLNTNEQTFSL